MSAASFITDDEIQKAVRERTQFPIDGEQYTAVMLPRETFDRILARTHSAEKRPNWRRVDEVSPVENKRVLIAVLDGDGEYIVGEGTYCKTPHLPWYGYHFVEGDPEDWDLVKPTHICDLLSPPQGDVW